MYTDPATSPEEVKAALLEQSPTDAITTMKVARLWETLRGEALKDSIKFKIQELDSTSQDHVVGLVDHVVGDLISFIKEFSYTPDEEDLDEAFDSFQNSFEVYARSVIAVRVAYAILRGAQVTESGMGSVDKEATNVDVFFGGEGGPQARIADTATEEEKLTWRATWVVQAGLDCDFRNLTPEEEDYIIWVAGVKSEDLTPSIIVTLESLLLKMQPNYYLFTKLGEDEMRKFQHTKIAEAITAVKDSGFKGLDQDEIDYVSVMDNTPEEDLTAQHFANMSRMHAKILMRKSP